MTPEHQPSDGGGDDGGDDGAENYSIFDLGDFMLESGEMIPNAWLAYKTYGGSSGCSGSQPKKPVIIYPTWFSGSIADNEWLIGARGGGRALDPAVYLIVVPAMIGNGESVSPSNTRRRRRRQQQQGKEQGKEKEEEKESRLLPFPHVSIRDNVTAQHRLLTAGLGIHHARLVLGWSMAAAQTYQWITQFPGFVDGAVPFCGSARTSPHNWVFLEGVKAALMASSSSSSSSSRHDHDHDHNNNNQDQDRHTKLTTTQYAPYWSPSQKDTALRALARVYAGWGLSQQFYRDKLHETRLGFVDLEDFMVNFWEKWAISKDPENLLLMIHTWQTADCSNQDPYHNDLSKAMAAIRSKTLVLPGQTDLYFPPEDSVYEVQCMRDGIGQCIHIPSIWGHWAGGPGTNPVDVKWLDDKLKAFLQDES